MCDARDAELAARLKRLDAGAAAVVPGFDYDTLLRRQAHRQARSRRRGAVARAAAAVLALAVIGASVWRLQPGDDLAEVPVSLVAIEPREFPAQPRIVRADSWLAVAALEDHIASLDDALNDARLNGGAADVARLERTRAELFASYSQLRYAERVSANF
jgi:hypothetical protein